MGLETYTIWNTGQITDNRSHSHVGWFLENLRTLTLAPYKHVNGSYGFNYPKEYPNAQINYGISSDDGKRKLFAELEKLLELDKT